MQPSFFLLFDYFSVEAEATLFFFIVLFSTVCGLEGQTPDLIVLAHRGSMG